MHFCYLLEDTGLCGGVKVVYEQAEALQERGHKVEILSKGPRPDWYHLRVSLTQVEQFLPSVVPECDYLIGTFWTTVQPACEAGKGRPAHLCQGYEGDTLAFAPQLREIESAYRLPTLMLTVHEPLTRLLWRRFQKRAYTVGQGINHTVFFAEREREQTPPWRVLLVGPYEIDWKGVREGLQVLQALKKELPLWIVRVSQWPFPEEEKSLGVVDEYHYRLSPRDMAALYRSCDVMLGPSWNQEGFGLPALEAIACGTPVVLSDIPAFRDFAEGEDWTVFFAERDEREMQASLQRVLQDRELRRRLRAQGLEIAERYTFARVAERIEQVLSEAERKVSSIWPLVP